MPQGTPVEIKPAKGRPMLTWVGKRPLRHVTAFPAQLVEKFEPQSESENPQSAIWEDWPDAYPRGGLLFHGDNKEVLAHLLANGFRGKVKLVYIDPPFDSGADYVRKVSLRGATGTAKLDGESYTLGEQVQYTDIWANDNYLQFMYERLMLLEGVTGGRWKYLSALRLAQEAITSGAYGRSVWERQLPQRDRLASATPHATIRRSFGTISMIPFCSTRRANAHLGTRSYLKT